MKLIALPAQVNHEGENHDYAVKVETDMHEEVWSVRPRPQAQAPSPPQAQVVHVSGQPVFEERQLPNYGPQLLMRPAPGQAAQQGVIVPGITPLPSVKPEATPKKEEQEYIEEEVKKEDLW